MSKLLLDDKPLIILPSLAGMIGLNESIVLQQLHYWLIDSKNIRDDFKWVYNTYEDWQKQFPFWSVSTIRRTITKLEKEKYIIVGNYNRLKIDNTKWYRIDYNSLDMNRPSVQNEQTECSKWTDGEVNLNRPLPEITTETTTETTTNIYIPFFEIVSYLNEKTNSKYKASSKKTKDLIKARWNDGFTLEDFKAVIDNKSGQWLNDTKMSEYLRPETLFGTKFESYLNQKGGTTLGKNHNAQELAKEYDFGF